MSEILAQREDWLGTDWVITREYNDGIINISLENQENEKLRKVVTKFWYRDICPEYKSGFLSWENLFFCSNTWGVAPFYDYMHSAVQEGRKTAATVYLETNTTEAQNLIKSLPKDCDWRSYGCSMLFVFHRGCLGDFFNLNKVKTVYDCRGVTGLDWALISDYFQKPLSFFADPNQCGFNIQGGDVLNEAAVVNGLLLGYPIESTIAWMKGTIKHSN